ncbi:D-isomer specific 2-hydroxyacid dehydrogenase [Aspergillus crustosus]
MADSNPRLAVLDDYQGISTKHFAHLESRLSITQFPSTLDPRDPAQQKELIERLKPFDIILTMRERTPFSASTLSQLPNLKLLLTTGTRNASLDTKYLAEKGIPVAGTESRPKRGVPSTAQHTWALILGLARHVARDDAAIKRGEWQGSLGVSVAGKTLGLVGLGMLGVEVGRIAKVGFGLDVIAWSTNLTQEKADTVAEGVGLKKGEFEVVSDKLEFFRRADIVSLHYVLSDRSRGIVGAEELKALKKEALLVNTSRGPLIDDKALLDVLERGGISGAALDVFETEPLPKGSPWRTTAWGNDGRSEVLLTPHTGYEQSAATTTTKTTPHKSTHPHLIQISHSPRAFSSAALSATSLPAGSLFLKITNPTPSRKAYTSVQTGRDSHIELNSDLVYCNHSCDPSLIFDMGKMEVRVVDSKPLKQGDALTFFYPSSEWEMDQAFECTCGAEEKCIGWVDGARNLGREVLASYWMNGHIEELLRERDGF